MRGAERRNCQEAEHGNFVAWQPKVDSNGRANEVTGLKLKILHTDVMPSRNFFLLPFSGMDVLAKRQVWKIIRREAARQWHTGPLPRPFIGPPPYPRPRHESRQRSQDS